MLDLKRLLNSLRFLILTLGLTSCGIISTMERTALSPPPAITPTQDYSTPVQLFGTPTPEPSPAITIPTLGSLQPVARVIIAARESILNMVAESNGTAWLLTDQRVLRYSQGTWADYLPQFDGTIIGLDSDHLVWVASDDGDRVSAWDGAAWTTLGPESGWEPLPANSSPPPGRWGITTDALGQIWITTNEDVRMFDGARWTVFDLNDLGMPRPEYDDALPETRIAFLKATSSIWAINCYWLGPGPDGGGGARWYDGQTWHGSDSPVALGCATSINEDDRGNVWLGLDNNLWRLNTSSGSWKSFPAPKPPKANRLGYFTDLALDSIGDPWPELSLCGGASCYVGSIRYHVTEGRWLQIGDVFTDDGSLYFDATGQGWLFRSSGVFRVIENRLEPVADLLVLRVATAPSGELWVVGLYKGETVLWTQAPAN
jgi:ligand-binding sensor domain-containing protein